MNKIILLITIILLVLLAGCATKEAGVSVNLQADAEKTAERFARYWEQKDWENMYDLFIPELTELRSKEDFSDFMNAWEKRDPIVIRLDKVLIDSENLTYAYYTVSSSIYDAKAPAMKMVFNNNSWKIDALSSAFLEECAEKPCVSTDICESTKCNKSTKFKCIKVPIENCCESDSDCPEDKSYCHDFECKKEECFSDSDCKIRFAMKDICNPTNHKCVECLSNSNCTRVTAYGTHYILCDKERGKCSCVTDADCNGLFCSNELFECVECFTDADCTTTGKPHCNHWGDAGKCVQCLTKDDCPRGYSCTAWSCESY